MMSNSNPQNQPYQEARTSLLNKWEEIVTLEKKYMKLISNLLKDKAKEIKEDYDQAIAIQFYWLRYPPEQRGRKPTGDAFPWGEVGEKVLEGYIYSSINKYFNNVRFIGLPYGHDIRFVTDQAFIHLDIKSTGPNDSADEVVSSRNQVSGDGLYCNEEGVYNSPYIIQGKGQKTQNFQPELPPFYIIHDQPIPTLTYYLKCVYSVNQRGNQPLEYLELICVPNGLIMFDGPKYADNVKGLLAIGKDDKTVKKPRCRIKLLPLFEKDNWRCQQIVYSNGKPEIVSRKPMPNVTEKTQIEIFNKKI